MASYKINFEAYSNNFALPQDIIDDNFDSLNPIYLKTILLIFKNSYKNYSINLISNLLNVSENEIENAVSYWINKGILMKKDNVQEKPEVISLNQKPMQQHSNTISREQSFLLECMENLLKRPVTSMEHKSILHILEFIKLPADVILMAIDYCISIDKVNARYIEKVCSSWADKGINNHELAEQYLTFLKLSKQNESKIKAVFGIQNRSLTDYESDCISRWINEYKFELDAIKLAYEKTVVATNKVAFPYINKILFNWHESGYHTIADIQIENNKKTNINGRQASYDIDELDRFWDTVPKLD